MNYLILNPRRYFRKHLPQKELFFDTLVKYFKEYDISYECINIVPREYDKATTKIIAFHTRDPEYINAKMSHLPDWFYFDRHGYNGWSEYGIHEPDFKHLQKDYVRKRFHDIQKYVLSNQLTKLYQDPSIPLPDYGDFLFVATQTTNDSVCRLMNMSWPKLLRDLRKIPYKIVIKRHPNCRDPAIERTLDEIVDNTQIFLSNASIHKLIPASKGVITGNSGVGFEALIYLKPVFLYAHSDYRWVCYTNIKFGSLIRDLALGFGDHEMLLTKKFVVQFLDNYLINVHNKESYLRRFTQLGIL